MIVLGLETSTAMCSVGLHLEGRPGIEQSIQESHIHSEKILTLVQQVMETEKIGMNELGAIAVSIGPGSFTGLRIGLSTAKGLGFALDIPLVAVPTFDAIAESGRQWHPGTRSILVLVDAKKEEWYFREYAVTNGMLQPVRTLALGSLEAPLALLKNEPSSLILTDQVSLVRKAAGELMQVEDVHPYCRGSVVADLGAKKAEVGDTADTASLEPTYLKDFIVRTLPASA